MLQENDMYRFFVSKNQIFKANHSAIITGEDVNHIKNVLRMKAGEEISLVVPDENKEYRCAIKEFSEEQVECELLFIKENEVELPVEIILYQALPKLDKMEIIIQKAVELGAARIVPVAAKRSVVKLDKDKQGRKLTRWEKIAEAAAKQSKRGIIPKISEVMTVSEALKDAAECNIRLFPYELCPAEEMGNTRQIIRNIKPGDRVAVFIGPEGGFSDEEAEEAVQAGFVPVTLGRRILRTETAGMVVLSWLVFELES